MQRCEELHRELIRKHADTPEVLSMANEVKNLQTLQNELAEAIEASQLRQEWVNHECDYCLGKSKDNF